MSPKMENNLCLSGVSRVHKSITRFGLVFCSEFRRHCASLVWCGIASLFMMTIALVWPDMCHLVCCRLM